MEKSNKIINKKNYNTIETPFSVINTETIDKELEDEIKYLESKLNIKKGKNYSLLKKKTKKDNFDADLFDFLDNIETIKKFKSNESNSHLKKNIKKLKDKASLKSKENAELLQLDNLQLNEASLNQGNNKEYNIINEIDYDNENITEKQKLFKKNLKIIFNKTSESNIQLLYKQVISIIEEYVLYQISKYKSIQSLEKIFEDITDLILSFTYDSSFSNIGVTSCMIMYACLFHIILGNNFIAYFLNKLFKKVNELIDVANDTNIDINNFCYKEFIFNEETLEKLRCFNFIMIYTFIFNSLEIELAYNLFIIFINNFNKCSQVAFIFIKNIGFEIRSSHPSLIATIYTELSKAKNNIQVNINNSNINKSNSSNYLNKYLTNINFVFDIVEDIKNNKYLKYNFKEKYNFFINLIKEAKNSNINSILVKKIEKSLSYINNNNYYLLLEDVKNFLIYKDKLVINRQTILNFDSKNLIISNLNNIENKDILKQNIKTLIKKNTNKIDSDDDISIDSDKIACDYNENNSNDNFANTKLILLCSKLRLNTDLKKSIFYCIINSTSPNETFEKLNKLSLNKNQEREIIKIIIITALNENSYNNYYTNLLFKIIKFNKDNKYTMQYTMWDYNRNIDELNNKQINILSLICSNLFIKKCIDFTCFITTDFHNLKQIEFIDMFLNNYLDNDFDKIKEDEISIKNSNQINKKNQLNIENNLKYHILKLIKNEKHFEFTTNFLQYLTNNYKSKIITKNCFNKIKIIENLDYLIKTIKRNIS